jgi:AhpD family alkylhydroperoxidase
MTRTEIYKDIEDKFGFVPTFMKSLNDSTLGLEWEMFKKVQLEEGVIPNKYKELMGIAIHAVSKCQYCTLFHSEMAKLNGATDAEIEEVLEYAKNSAGWSAYVNGLQLDYETFKGEVKRAVEYVREKGIKKAA